MADNVFSKLQTAKVMFLDKGVTKSGKNMHMEFTYFELADIVPVAERIFAEVGLSAIPRIDQDSASMLIVNNDDPAEDFTSVSIPFAMLEPIVSNNGKEVTNRMQALGSSITYMRRYLWMLALDIVEPDEIDSSLGMTPPPPAPPAPKAPQPPVEDKADPAQIESIRAGMKKLMALDPSQEEFCTKVAVETGGFARISRSTAAALITTLTDMVGQYEEVTSDGDS